MRVLFITQFFQPEPQFKGIAFARQLRSLGHDVEILTGFPNYPGGKVYDGYRIKAFQRETLEGFPVLRVPLYPSHNRSSWRRILNYASFAFSASVAGVLLTRRPDVVYVYHPPGPVALPAMVLQALRGVPFVYDVNDLWPDSLSSTGMMTRPFLLRLVDRWCNLVYRRANRVVVISNGLRRLLLERGVPEGKLHVIHNWCDESAIQTAPEDPELRSTLGFEGRFNVVFAGTMGRAQALDAVLKAAQLLASDCPDVRFVFIGSGIDVDRLRNVARELQLDNVEFLPRRPIETIGQVLNLADVLLVHLKDDPLFEVTVPSKTQAYLAAGRPVLMAVRGDAADIVQAANAGVSCEPENPRAIAEAVRALRQLPREELHRMGQRGKQYYEQELSIEVGTAKFAAVFSEVTNARAQERAGVPEPS